MKYFQVNNYFKNQQTGEYKDIFLIIVIHIIILPIITLYNNTPDLDKFFYFPITHSFVLTAFVFLFFLFILLIFKKFFLNKYFSFIFRYILVWSVFVGIFFPILGNGDKLIINFFNIELFPKPNFFVAVLLMLIKIIGVFLITKLLIEKKYFNQFRNFIIIFLILNFLIHLILVNKRENGLSLEKITKYSKTENLITLSFDGISNSSFERVIKNNRKFLNALNDFNFYKNINSHSSGTYVSLIYELYGGFDEKIDYKNFNQEEIFDYIKPRRINLQNTNFDTQTYGQFNDFFKGDVDKFYQPTFYNISKGDYFYFFFREVTVPSFTRTVSYIFDLSRFLNSSKIQKFLFNKNKTLTNTNLKTFDDFLYIIENTETDLKKKKIIKLFHFNFSHSPVEIDKNCEIKYYDKNWIKSEEFKKKDDEISECVLNLLTGFFEKLKSEGLYQNSTIIIKSDHGRERYYYDEYPENITINNNVTFSYGRYNPLLMIKMKNASSKKIKFIYNNIYSRDLNEMYCFFLEKTNCSQKKSGFNFFMNTEKINNLTEEIFLPKRKDSYIFLSESEHIYIDREKENLIDFLKNK
tara:strand:+ start:2493 stop:4232 length:1740 start_codon:yes stop_codon:yes gene_type:complete